MDMKNDKSENTFITEAICTNCKGKGSTFGVRMKAKFSGIGTMIGGFVISTLAESSSSEFFGGVLVIAGLAQILLSRRAKCPVCEGTGKVKLNVEPINTTKKQQGVDYE